MSDTHESYASGGPLALGLGKHTVGAFVTDIDYHHDGLLLETDFVIQVKSTEATKRFEDFRISKTFSAFRNLVNSIQVVTDAKHFYQPSKTVDKKNPEVRQLIKFAIDLNKVVNQVSVNYFGKLTYKSARKLSKNREDVVNKALSIMLSNYPDDNHSNPTVQVVASSIENFFLTDYVIENDAEDISSIGSVGDNSSGMKKKLSEKKKRISAALISRVAGPKTKALPNSTSTTLVVVPEKKTIVVPKSVKNRCSLVERKSDLERLESLGDNELILKDSFVAKSDNVTTHEVQSNNQSTTVNVSSPRKEIVFFKNPIYFSTFFLTLTVILKMLAHEHIKIDMDVALFVCFACFCVGRYSSERQSSHEQISSPSQQRKSTNNDEKETFFRRSSIAVEARDLVAKSFGSCKSFSQSAMVADVQAPDENGIGHDDDYETDFSIISPLPRFPKNGDPAKNLNCVSEPDPGTFFVRGQNYFSDRKKVNSGPYIFPFRGVDLFLTDSCPENIGRNRTVLGGKLRDIPSFIINFRLPWGVAIFFFEIPSKFLPFLNKGYNPNFTGPLPPTDTMSPAEKLTCKFLMGTDEYKNQTLKIVPVVIIGPWIVKSVVGGKPAIVGTKMPINYVYQPPSKGNAEYLEADLDIVSSSAARGILSVVRSHTKGITLDLGFVIQGNSEEELPEQMLTGTRLHGIDPITASHLPPMPDDFAMYTVQEQESDITTS